MKRFALCVVLAGLLALPARAAIWFGGATGSIDILGQIGMDPGLPSTDFAHFSRGLARPLSGPFQQTFQDSISDPRYGLVSAMASQMSSINQTPDGQLIGASFAATSAVSAATLFPYGSCTQALSTQTFYFQVTDTPAHYTIKYLFTPLGPIADSYLALRDITGGTFTIIAQAASGLTDHNGDTLTGTLSPGWYSFLSYVQSDTLAPTAQAVALANSMTLTFGISPAPEPATLLLLALGTFFALRRR